MGLSGQVELARKIQLDYGLAPFFYSSQKIWVWDESKQVGSDWVSKFRPFLPCLVIMFYTAHKDKKREQESRMTRCSNLGLPLK